jgi:iron complex outermembrane receptor protein
MQPLSLRFWALCTLLWGLAYHVSAQTNLSEASPDQLKKLSLEELMDVDITSVSRRPEPLRQAPAAIQVITQEDMRRAGVTSIPEALRLADNLQVAQVNSQTWAITARGFSDTIANKLLVMMDGRNLYTPLFSGTFWDVQDYQMEDIDRIEVVSGPGGTVWGANAVNGVINIITKSAKDTQGLLISASGGNELHALGGIRYGGMLASNVYYRVYGKGFDRDSTVLGNGSDAQDAWRMGQGGFRIDWDAPGSNVLTMQGDGYGGDLESTVPANTKVSGGNILGRWSHTISDDSDTTLQLYYDRTHRHIAPLVFTEDFHTFDVDFQYHGKFADRHNLVVGTAYRYTHDLLQNGPPLSFLPPNLDRNLFSGFLQDEVMLRDDLFFTLGTKIEHNDYTGLEFEPGGRLAWDVTTNQLLWAAISRAVRMPSRIDAELFAPSSPPFLIAGGPDFVSETVIAYELGYRAQVLKTVSASISLFFNQYDDLRSVSTNSPFIIQNDVEGDTYGSELAVTYQPVDFWRLRFGYTVLQEDLRVEPGKADLNQARSQGADPQQQFSLTSTIDIPRGFELDTRLRWVDQREFFSSGAFAGTVPSYFELDVHLGWHVTKNLELAVVGQNLLHNHHPEFGAPGPTRNEIERGLYGKVVFRF